MMSWAYAALAFSKDGKSAYLSTDARSEFRQLARVESRFEPEAAQYLVQPDGRWAKKLGAPALLRLQRVSLR